MRMHKGAHSHNNGTDWSEMWWRRSWRALMCGSGLVYGIESQHQLGRRVLHCVLRSVLISLWHAHCILRIRACPERHARMGGASLAQPLSYSFPVVQAPLLPHSY